MSFRTKFVVLFLVALLSLVHGVDSGQAQSTADLEGVWRAQERGGSAYWVITFDSSGTIIDFHHPIDRMFSAQGQLTVAADQSVGGSFSREQETRAGYHFWSQDSFAGQFATDDTMSLIMTTSWRDRGEQSGTRTINQIWTKRRQTDPDPDPTPDPDPQPPQEGDCCVQAGYLQADPQVGRVFVQGNYAYIGDRGTLRIADVSNPATPAEIGAMACDREWCNVSAVQVADNLVYANQGGLWILDVTDPTAPVVLSWTEHCSDADLFIDGRTAYVTDGCGSPLVIYDVTDPAAPIRLGGLSVEAGYGAQGVFVLNGYAYLAALTDGLKVIDVSNPAAPVEVGSTTTGGDCRDVWAEGTHLYVADTAGGLKIYDISNPAAPNLVGQVPTASPIDPDDQSGTQSVQIIGNYAYLADGYGGLRVVNVANPANPAAIGSVAARSGVDEVYVAPPYAYLADSYSGIRIIDVSAYTGTGQETRSD